MKLKTLLLKFVVLGISAVFILFGILFILRLLQAKKDSLLIGRRLYLFLSSTSPFS